MITDFQSIVDEWSYRVGIIDLKDTKHLYHLNQILYEHGWTQDVIDEISQNLTEDDIVKNKKSGNTYVVQTHNPDTQDLVKKDASKDDIKKVDKGEEPKEKPEKQNITKKQIKVAEDLKEDLDFILENRDAVRLKSGGGSNSPSVQDVKDLKTFTEKRMEQDRRRLEAEERGEEFNEEPYVHPSIRQREVDDETLDKAIDYLEKNLEPKEFEALIKRFAKGGAVPRHLTKLTKLKKGQPGYPGLDKESPGYKRAREIIRLYLKNDAKSPVTGKP